MSHVGQIKTVFKNIKDVEAAAARLGGKLHYNKHTVRMYASGFVDDTTQWKEFFSPEEAARIARLPRDQRIEIINKLFASADHVISFPSANYDVGVYKAADGTYRIRYDSWAGGGGLTKIIGANGGKFAQAYGIEAAKRAARLRGYFAKETPGHKPGSIKLELLVR